MTASRITDSKNLDKDLKELQVQLYAATLLVGHLEQVQHGFDGLEKRANVLDGQSRTQMADHVKAATKQHKEFLTAGQSHTEGLERLRVSTEQLERFTVGAQIAHEARWSGTTTKVAELLESVEKAAELTKADLTLRHQGFKKAYATELKTLQSEHAALEKRVKKTQTATTYAVILGLASVATAFAVLVLK